MDTEEAKTILANLAAVYRTKSYAELQHLLNEQDTSEVVADSGVRYQVEFQAVWDGKEGEDLRVIGAIDDRGQRAFVPLTVDFIMNPNGGFVGE